MRKTTHKILSLLLAAVLVLGLIPFMEAPALATADSGSLFEDLGFDLRDPSPGASSNPYGRDNVTVQEVSELYIGNESQSTGSPRTWALHGHDDAINYNTASRSGSNMDDTNKYDAYLTAAGDFTGSGKRDKIVAIGANTKTNPTTENRADAGLFMYFIVPMTGDVGTGDNIFALYQGEIGNTYELDNRFLRYNAYLDNGTTDTYTKYNPILLHNYMQVVTGDFTGDSVDEIAVYIPDPANPRVEVYQFQSGGSDTDWWTKAKWVKIYTHSVRLAGQSANIDSVPNRVSLTAGDLDYDGVDDLVIGYGKANYNKLGIGMVEGVAATVLVLFGADDGNPFRTSTAAAGETALPAEFGLTIGDPDGSGRDKLIFAGIGGVKFSSSSGGDDPFYYDATTVMYVWQHHAASNTFVRTSLVLGEGSAEIAGMGNIQVGTHVRADVVALSQGVGQPDNIYYRGYLYTAQGGKINRLATSLYQAPTGWAATILAPLYTLYLSNQRIITVFEYGMSATDFNGDGKDELVFSYSPTQKSVAGPVAWPTQVAVVELNIASPSYLGFGIPKVYYDGFGITSGEHPNRNRSHLLVATPDTDEDSRRLSFVGRTFAHTDPKLIAVMAGAPLWKDLEYLDQGDGYIGESGTTWATSSGSGTGSSNSSQFSLGAYIGYEYEIPLIASFEMELEYKHSWTTEYESMTTVTETVSYGASGYTDAVALYSIPMDIYTFNETVDGKTQEVYINFPHSPSVTVMSVDEYEGIAKNYPGVLPIIRGTMLTHTQGRPDTYNRSAPAAIGNINDVRVYSGSFSGVGFGSGTQSQAILVETEESESTKSSDEFSFKLGGGGGGLKAGITLGGAWERGKTKVTISGTEFSGEVYNMPEGARNFGYAYSWKIMQYWYKYGDGKIPVVSYIVDGVNAANIISPPRNLDIDAAESTMRNLTLTWEYDEGSGISGFQVYRQEAGGVFTEVWGGFVDYNVSSDEYTFTDTGLASGSEYTYRVEAVKGNDKSIPSNTASGWTLATDQLSVTLSSYSMLMYPDRSYTVSSSVASVPGGGAVSYSWEKYVNGKWTVTGVTTKDLVTSSPKTATAGEYRLRVMQTVNNSPAMAYSQTLTIVVEKYDAFIDTTVSENNGDLTITAMLTNENSGSGSQPGGMVTFEVSHQGAAPVAYSAAITKTARNGAATVTIKDATDGNYDITPVYSGDGIFYYGEGYPVRHYKGGGESYYIVGPGEVYYGVPFTPAIWMAMQTGLTQITGTADVYKADFVKLQYIKYNDGAYELTDAENDMYSVDGLKITPEKVLTGDIATLPSTVTYEGLPYHFSAVYRITGPNDFEQDLTFTYKVRPIPVMIAASSFEVEQENIKQGSVAMINDPEYFIATSAVEGGGLMFGHDASDFFNPRVYNNGGQEVNWNKQVAIGVYTIKAVRNDSNPDLYTNYSFTTVEGKINVTGKKHQLTTQVNDTNFGSLSVSPADPDSKYIYSTNLTFTAQPKTGYEVEKWEVFIADSQSPQSTQNGQNTFTYPMPANSIRVLVTFRQKDITLAYGARPAQNGTVTVSPNTITSGTQVLEGTQLSFTAMPNEGSVFSEWWVFSNDKTTYYEGTPGENGASHLGLTMPGYSTEVTAVFTRESYPITLSDGLTASYVNDRNQTVTVKSGDYVVGDTLLTVQPEQGKTIVEWIDYMGSLAPSFGDVPQSCVYIVTEVASFAATVKTFYTLTVTAPQDGTIAVKVNGIADDVSDFVNGVQLVSGDSVTLTAAANNGFNAGYWTTKIGQTDAMHDLGSSEISFTITDDMTLSHVFVMEAANPKVIYDGSAMSCSDNDGDVTSGDEVTPGTQLTFTADIPEGHKVVKWTVTIGGVPVVAQTGKETYSLTMPEYDIKVTVETAVKTFSVTVRNDDAHGSYILDCGVGVDLNAVPVNSTVALRVTPDENWRILSITGAEFDSETTTGGVTTYVINSLNANTIITITYADNTDYIITVTPASNGTVTAPATAKAGDSVTLAVTPDSGYNLDTLTVKNASSESVIVGANHVFTMPDSNVTVTVAFTSTGGGGGGGGGTTVIENYYTIINNGQELKLSDVNPKKEIYVIDLTKTTTNNIYVELAVADLTKIAEENPDFILVIATSFGHYRVPVNLASLIPGLDALLDKNNLTAKDISIKVELINVSTDPTISAALASSLPDARVMGTIVDFKVYVINAKTKEVLRDAETFTENIVRMIPVNTKPRVRYGAFRYDEAMRSFAFIPHTAVVIDGQWYIAIASRTNSVYAVAENEVDFTDVNKTHWAISYIERASAKRLVVGIGNNQYAPESSVTRAEFVQMMANALWLPAASAETKAYDDVKAGNWYYAAIMKARSAGLLDKFTRSDFMPNQVITREEMAAILAAVVRYEKYTVTGSTVDLRTRFNDHGSMNADYLDNIELVCRSGLMQGVSENTFSPDGVTTRAQAATVQIRLLEMLGMID